MADTDFHRVGLPLGFVAADTSVAPATFAAFLEGPAVAANGDVYFSDIINNRILKLDPPTGRFTVFREPSGRTNGLLFDAQGRLLACEGNEFGPNDGHRRITRTDMATGKVEVLTDRFDGKRYNAPNDIAACSNGRIFFTDSLVPTLCVGTPLSTLRVAACPSIRNGLNAERRDWHSHAVRGNAKVPTRMGRTRVKHSRRTPMSPTANADRFGAIGGTRSGITSGIGD